MNLSEEKQQIFRVTEACYATCNEDFKSVSGGLPVRSGKARTILSGRSRPLPLMVETFTPDG